MFGANIAHVQTGTKNQSETSTMLDIEQLWCHYFVLIIRLPHSEYPKAANSHSSIPKSASQGLSSNAPLLDFPSISVSS